MNSRIIGELLAAVIAIAITEIRAMDPKVDDAIRDALKKYPAGDYDNSRLSELSFSKGEEEALISKTRDFIHRTNPKLDLSTYDFVVTVPDAATGDFHDRYVVLIKERGKEGENGRLVARTDFDALGQVAHVEWLNQR